MEKKKKSMDYNSGTGLLNSCKSSVMQYELRCGHGIIEKVTTPDNSVVDKMISLEYSVHDFNLLAQNKQWMGEVHPWAMWS